MGVEMTDASRPPLPLTTHPPAKPQAKPLENGCASWYFGGITNTPCLSMYPQFPRQHHREPLTQNPATRCAFRNASALSEARSTASP